MREKKITPLVCFSDIRGADNTKYLNICEH